MHRVVLDLDHIHRHADALEVHLFQTTGHGGKGLGHIGLVGQIAEQTLRGED